jgi:hypothetical protein
MSGYDEIKQLAKVRKCNIPDLLVLAPQNDPFYAGGKTSRVMAEWFADLWEQFGFSKGVHLRRIHYRVVTTGEVMKPNGLPYENTEGDWGFLEHASKHARHLGLVAAAAFADHRNPKPHIFCLDSVRQDPSWEADFPPWPIPHIETDLANDLDWELPEFEVTGYEYNDALQPYHLEIWVEKSTVNDELLPLCRRYGVNLVTGVGFMSITSVVSLLQRMEARGKPARILYISDFDPAGDGMPTAVARQIEFQLSGSDRDFDIKLTPILLTKEQVEHYQLPRIPVKDSDRRKAQFEEHYGEGAVELDALVALHPGALEEIVKGYIRQFRDESLEEELAIARQKAKDNLHAVWQERIAPYQERLDDLKTHVEDVIEKYQSRLTALSEALDSEIAPYQNELNSLRLGNEIIVNPFRSKFLEDWDRDLRIVFAQCYRVLKPGRWMSVCFHDTDPITWTLLQNALLDMGFELSNVGTIDPEQKSQNQYTAEKVAKADLVLNCRKPRPKETRENSDGEIGLVSHRVRDILIETLANTGGQTRDRLWDVVLKRLLSRGQMAEHRFDDILSEVAFRSESGRWFLKEEFESLSDNDIRNEENAGDALVRFARLRMAGVLAAFAAEIVSQAPQLATGEIDEPEVERYIRLSLIKDRKDAATFSLGGRLKGVEFYDCLFFYLTRWLKGRAPGRTPRRNLAEFLDEYLVRFKDGDKWLHRPPNDAEAESLRKARQTGLGRRIRQYVSFLNGGGEFPHERLPDAKTLVAWLKHCAAFGLAEEGVLLFEKGGLVGQLSHLSEDDRYDAEDYYAQCRRRAGKTAAVEDREDDVTEEESSDE